MKIGLVPQVVINAMYPSISVPYVPLGLLCLGAACDRRRHDLEIVDLTRAVKDGTLPYDQDFEKAAARLILEKHFDLVGFSTFSCTYHHTLKIVREMKALSPSTPLVFGGPQASFCHEETMAAFPVDVVVRGEGEVTFPELLECLAQGREPGDVRGVTFRRGSRVICTEERPFLSDLDALPLPAYDLYPMARQPNAPIELTRGCPCRCTFCATSTYWKRTVRHKSIDRVCTEMALLCDEFDVQYISFADDMFTSNRAWATAFCERLATLGLKKKWFCATRVDAVDDELLKLMARAGCDQIFYGVESGSEKIQKAIRKNIKVDRVVESLRLTAANGIRVTASLMMGFPDETEEDLAQTLKLRNQIQLLFPSKQAIQMHVLSPDVFTEISLEYRDRLRYDGYHSDQSGKINSRYDLELIQKHPNLFLAYYYIETPFLDRELVKLVDCFLFATQVVCYWSSLYVMLRDGDPFVLVKAWVAFFKEHTGMVGGIRDGPLLNQALSATALFFQDFFKPENGIPLPVIDLFGHEFEMMRLKGGLVIDEDMRQRNAGKRTLSTRQFDYDPRETIALIRQDFRKVALQGKRPTKIDYAPKNRQGTAPDS
jgi:radical SAM superfamily enzyme YgiQ (UPF0313 family)